MDVSVVIPCLDEEATVGTCVKKALSAIAANGIDGEVVVADNGSTDRSVEIAEANGARVVHEEEKGYGRAIMAGVRAAKGTYVLIGDADDSYHFEDLPAFLAKLREGNDLVMGNRFRGGIEPHAMTLSHRLGNPVLSLLGRVLFGTKIGDFNCGIRAMRRDALLSLDLRTGGMEFATEMIAKASLAGLRIDEVPTKLSRDGRDGPPHLRTIRDGIRCVSYMFKQSAGSFAERHLAPTHHARAMHAAGGK